MQSNSAIRELTALVVEDNPSLRDYIKGFLLTMGVRKVRVARHGTQALSVLEDEEIGLIISDAKMPGGDGVPFLEAIRKTPKWCEIPFIMVSGFPEEAVAKAALFGVSDFIVKPFTFEVLQEKVMRVLNYAPNSF